MKKITLLSSIIFILSAIALAQDYKIYVDNGDETSTEIFDSLVASEGSSLFYKLEARYPKTLDEIQKIGDTWGKPNTIDFDYLERKFLRIDEELGLPVNSSVVITQSYYVNDGTYIGPYFIIEERGVVIISIKKSK